MTAHDGFTLQDLVSYNDKHNEANGENNQDGANDNNSWNMGAEGPTDDPDHPTLRERQKRNFLATLLLSQGVPMFCGGDEIGRTQNGNNNAYCRTTKSAGTTGTSTIVPQVAGLHAAADRVAQVSPEFAAEEVFPGSCRSPL